MTTNFANLFILVGALHGLVLSLLLVTTGRGSRLANCLLAAMLVCFTLPLLKVTLLDVGFFSTYGLAPWSVELLYGLGPSLFLYVRGQTGPADRPLSPRDWLHFVPVGMEALYYASALYGGHATDTFWPPHSRLHLIWMLQQLGAVVSLLVYFLLTNGQLRSYARWVGDNFSNTHRRNLRWLSLPVRLYTVFFVLWLGLRAVDVIGFGDALAVAVYYPLLLFLAASTYWIGTTGYLHRGNPVIDPFPDSGKEDLVATPKDGPSDASNDQFTGDTSEVFDGDSVVVGLEVAEVQLFENLECLMSQQRLYLDSELSLTELAHRLAVNPRRLSYAINTGAKMNFYDFVNGYRVEEFKRLLRLEDQRSSLLDLAFEAGFGSKATFNAVFKKRTGLTPSQYRRRLKTAASEGKAEP